MSLNDIIQEARALSVEERKQLVMAILDSLTEQRGEETASSIMDYQGAGKPADGNYTDADAYVRQLRDEWDQRPESSRPKSILDFEGIGAHLRDDSVDVQEYLNELRDEWDREP